MPADAPTQLIVFSDDWGRHPSSCQHLVSRLLPRYPTLWVNTIGTRFPRLSMEDAAKVVGKIKEWSSPTRNGAELPANLRVISPRMWPGFRKGWQRGLNARWISGAVNRAISGPLTRLEDSPPSPGRSPRPLDGVGAHWERGYRIAITTIPVTADVIGKIEVDRWVYYCVDDFSSWPGLDAQVMQEMERKQVGKVDRVIAVSETLQKRLSAMGREAELLTHGIDLEHWTPGSGQGTSAKRTTMKEAGLLPEWWKGLPRPIMLFWGLVDGRLDAAWCRALIAAAPGGTLALVGPQQIPPPELSGMKGVVMPGPVDYEALPALAAEADILIMPYADLPVTRAMQPLKFKEYLAAGYPNAMKPVIVRDLPATRPWADAADVVNDVNDVAAVMKERLQGGLPAAQIMARKRLESETWDEKARQFESLIFATGRD